MATDSHSSITSTLAAENDHEKVVNHDSDHDHDHDQEQEQRVVRPMIADPLELPYRILSNGADMGEFTEETPTGLRPHRTMSRMTGKEEDYELVTFTPNDKENPKNWSKAYKWWCTMVVAFTCFAVAFNSAVITADLKGVEDSFGVSEEVALVTITVRIIHDRHKSSNTY